jgi:c-di-GMP-binding flagellar brake protein YcgR
MAEKSGRNLRRHVRVKPERNRPIRIDINGLDFIDVFTATDISESGIGLVVPHRFQDCRIDQEISLVLTFPDPVQATVTTRARIRHVTEKSFGVQFVNLSEGERRTLRRYIAHRLQDEPLLLRLKFWLGLV